MAKCEFWVTWPGRDSRDKNTEYCPVLKFNAGCKGENCISSPEARDKYVRSITTKPQLNRRITPTHFP